MVNDNIIQNFIRDLGTLTCSELDAINYFRSSGEDPQECLMVLRTIPNLFYVNEKIWVDRNSFTKTT